LAGLGEFSVQKGRVQYIFTSSLFKVIN
jgi:hypothetical protein